ncbi:DUF2637 domain-containing protein [Nonomuraea glycinis]|uniref:DUF2637 domain-containing protein n=1 Tax=Nonomuraea glycinis TaxID=2047744 RepID=UPI00166AC85B|nr:DUF2637 domain-containing protein [Nonomuraea glycinis]
MKASTRAVRRIQRPTIAGVLLLAVIAAIVSFRHRHELRLRHGDDHLAAVHISLAVDGMIFVVSMSILLANRYGSRGGFLAWALLVGSLASRGAKHRPRGAEPSRPPSRGMAERCLIGSYELLMSRVRRTASKGRAVVQGTVTEDRQLGDDDGCDSSEEAVFGRVRRSIFVGLPGSGPWRIAFRTWHSRLAGSSLSGSRGVLDGAAGLSGGGWRGS